MLSTDRIWEPRRNLWKDCSESETLGPTLGIAKSRPDSRDVANLPGRSFASNHDFNLVGNHIVEH